MAAITPTDYWMKYCVIRDAHAERISKLLLVYRDEMSRLRVHGSPRGKCAAWNRYAVGYIESWDLKEKLTSDLYEEVHGRKFTPRTYRGPMPKKLPLSKRRPRK